MPNISEYKLNTWEEFLERVNLLEPKEEYYNEHGRRLKGLEDYLYRGQADSELKITPTLFRKKNENDKLSKERLQRNVPLDSYLNFIQNFENECVKTEVILESLRGMDLTYSINQELNPSYDKAFFMKLPVLRHLGFPSPIIDWSGNPLVAAYFAFSEKKGEFVSIFAIKYSIIAGGSWGNKLIDIERYNRPTCINDETQDSYYMLTYETKIGCFPVFIDFEKCMKEKGGELIKFVLPASEREKVLEYLDQLGINQGALLAM